MAIGRFLTQNWLKRWAFLLLAPLVACSGEPDTGDMPEQAAIDKCHAELAKKDDVGEITETAAIKADRYWEVNGATETGTFHCVINAVNEELVIASWGS